MHTARVDLASGRPLSALHKLRHANLPEPSDPDQWILRARMHQLFGDATMLLADKGRFAAHTTTAAAHYNDALQAVTKIPDGNTKKLYQAAIQYGQAEVLRVQGVPSAALMLGMFARALLIDVGPATNRQPCVPAVHVSNIYGDEVEKLEARRLIIAGFLTRTIGFAALQHGGLDRIAEQSFNMHNRLARSLTTNAYAKLTQDDDINQSLAMLCHNQHHTRLSVIQNAPPALAPMQRNYPIGPIIGPAIDLPDTID